MVAKPRAESSNLAGAVSAPGLKQQLAQWWRTQQGLGVCQSKRSCLAHGLVLFPPLLLFVAENEDIPRLSISLPLTGRHLVSVP